MSEMALTATRVIVIGKGHLIADSTVDALGQGRHQRRPAAHTDARSRFPPPPGRRRARSQTTDDGALMVTGLEPSAIGDIAFYAQAPVHELSLLEASLEEAFMELTRDDVEYHARGDGSPGTGGPNGEPTTPGAAGRQDRWARSTPATP